MFYGNGAGGAPTASAVLGDLVGAARNKILGGRAPAENPYAHYPVADFGDVPTRYHIDMSVVDRAGVLAEISRRFAAQNISISAVRQEESGEDSRLIVVTHESLERKLSGIVEELREIDEVKAINSVIRLGA